MTRCPFYNGPLNWDLSKIKGEMAMNNQRLRDMAVGFVLCLSLVVSFYCGASGSPTSADASTLGSSDYAVVGGVDGEGELGYVVVDKTTGRSVYSELINDWALGSAGGHEIAKSERYW